MRAMVLGLVLTVLPVLAGAQELSSQRDYSDPAQRDLPIACKADDRESFPGKTLGEVFGADWPAQPMPSSPDAHVGARTLERGPMRWPRGLDPQDVYVVVAVLVAADGSPVRAEILCTTRIGFDAAVRRHAMASTYAPAEADGVPITSALVRVVSFRPSKQSRAVKPGR